MFFLRIIFIRRTLQTALFSYQKLLHQFYSLFLKNKAAAFRIINFILMLHIAEKIEANVSEERSKKKFKTTEKKYSLLFIFDLQQEILEKIILSILKNAIYITFPYIKKKYFIFGKECVLKLT